jgi:hypothetical protein
MTPMKINTVLIPLMKKKHEKQCRKAAKLGMVAPDLVLGDTKEERAAFDTIGSYKVGKGLYFALYTEVYVSGDAPVISGHRFIATVDLKGEKPMVRKQPFLEDDVDLARFHTTDGRCDHCNTIRGRNDVLVIQNVETGELMQLGRNCANDFFGTKDAAQRIACSDWEGAYGNITDTTVKYENSVNLRRIYEIAAAVVRTHGWVHHRDCKFDNSLSSTKSRVWDNLFPWSDMNPDRLVTVLPEDEEEAEVVMAWLQEKFLSVPTSEANDFIRNVQAAVEGQDSIPYVRVSNLNYVIWGIAGYTRDLQKDAEERRIKAEQATLLASSDHVGTIGDRVEMTLRLVFKHALGSEFGIRYLQKFTDPDGNVVIWWGTNETSARTKVGDTYVFKATIKSHDIYEGMKQTTVTRAALIAGDLEEE